MIDQASALRWEVAAARAALASLAGPLPPSTRRLVDEAPVPEFERPGLDVDVDPFEALRWAVEPLWEHGRADAYGVSDRRSRPSVTGRRGSEARRPIGGPRDRDRREEDGVATRPGIGVGERSSAAATATSWSRDAASARVLPISARRTGQDVAPAGAALWDPGRSVRVRDPGLSARAARLPRPGVPPASARSLGVLSEELDGSRIPPAVPVATSGRPDGVAAGPAVADPVPGGSTAPLDPPGPTRRSGGRIPQVEHGPPPSSSPSEDFAGSEPFQAFERFGPAGGPGDRGPFGPVALGASRRPGAEGSGVGPGRAHGDTPAARPPNGGPPEDLDEDAVMALVGRALAEEARRNGVDLS